MNPNQRLKSWHLSLIISAVLLSLYFLLTFSYVHNWYVANWIYEVSHGPSYPPGSLLLEPADLVFWTYLFFPLSFAFVFVSVKKEGEI